MKIYGDKLPGSLDIKSGVKKVSKSEVKDSKVKGVAGEAAKAADRIEISGRGKEISALRSVVNQMPETRDEKVNALREAINSGRYNIDSLKLAGKILTEI